MIPLSFAIIAWIVFSLVVGLPLFVLLGGITSMAYLLGQGAELSGVVEDIYFAADKEILTAIPMFILAGAIMTHGSIARRMIRMASAITAPLPAGLGVSAVASCALFAAISGSSPVTLIAIGSMMFPALLSAGYDRANSIGTLAAGGTLGIIIPPSIPMIVYAIMAGTSVTEMFIAGILPGLLLAAILMFLMMVRETRLPRGRWSPTEVTSSFREGGLSLILPVIVLGGIYSGFFTATEAAVVAVAGAALVELGFYRELKWRELGKVFSESCEMLGIIFFILLFATSLNKYMIYEQLPQRFVETLSGMISTPTGFLLGVNLLLLITGCFMDVMSAILVLAPLLAPMALHYGVDPVHFGIIMIVNLEIGYLTPPVGINLFVASAIFKEPIGGVIRSVWPMTLALLLGLMIITFWPDLSLTLLGKN